jgi:hypothetical protein
MRPENALLGGLAGAAAVTLIHETARQFVPGAPRVDVIGMRALAKPMRRFGRRPPSRDRLYWLTLIGELVSNSVWYAAAGAGDRRGVVERGAALGLVGGLGAVVLPPVVGLGRQPHHRTPWTQVMTVAWYTVGGVVAGAVMKELARDD